jgi:hypothetical protein
MNFPKKLDSFLDCLHFTLKMCLNEICSVARIGKHLSDAFLVQNGLNEEMLYCHCF